MRYLRFAPLGLLALAAPWRRGRPDLWIPPIGMGKRSLMLRTARHSVLFVIPFVALSFLLSSCAESDAPDGSSVVRQEADGVVQDTADFPTVYVDARWASNNAKDLPTLLRSTGVVFVGNVVGLKEQRFENLIPPQRSGSLDPEAEAKPTDADGPPPFPISLFDVRVERSLAGGLREGSSVTVQQAGGITERSDGTTIRLVLEFDEPLEANTTYLFWVSGDPNDSGTLVTSPFARLKLEADGRFLPLPAWSHLNGLRELTGLDIEQAEQVVTSVAAQ